MSHLTDEQIARYRTLDRDNLRSQTLGYILGKVHYDNEHEEWSKLSQEEKEALRARAAAGPRPTAQQVEYLP